MKSYQILRSIVGIVLIVENFNFWRFKHFLRSKRSIRLIFNRGTRIIWYCTVTKRIIPHLIKLKIRDRELHKNILMGAHVVRSVTKNTTDYLLTGSSLYWMLIATSKVKYAYFSFHFDFITNYKLKTIVGVNV